MYRRVLSFIAVIGVAFLWACDNGSDGEPANNTIVGTWNLVSLEGTITAEATVGPITVSTENNLNVLDPNYQITFTETEFTASGEYTIQNRVLIDEVEFGNFENRINNVSGSGTYSSTDTELVFSSGFFDFNLDGTDMSGSGGGSTTSYVISGNTLTMTQNEIQVVSEQGAVISTSYETTVVWTRQ